MKREGAQLSAFSLNATILRVPADTFVPKSMCDHVFGLIDIAKVNNDRARHRALQAVQVTITNASLFSAQL